MIEIFPTVSATLTRTAETFSKGRVVQGASTVIPLTIVVPQPASQKDLQMLPDGERSYDHQRTYTESAEVRNRDVIAYSGKNFKVVAVGAWTDPDTMQTYYRVLIREVTHVN